MTIINKEGNVYILKGPNPLVEQQENWDFSKLIFHNFTWEEIKSNISKEKPHTAIPKPSSQAGLDSEYFHAQKNPEKQDSSEIHESKKEPAEKPDQKVFDLPHIKYKILSHCLPAKTEKKIDNLYGDAWERLTYKEKIVFPMVMINNSDFFIEFWTSDPDQQITEKSIIYPFSYEVYNQQTNSYDKVPYDEYRWWKVDKKEKKKEGGWLFTAIPSELQPDFSG